MSISTNPLVDEATDKYRIVLLPESHLNLDDGQSYIYTTLKNIHHPVSGIHTDFVVAHLNSGIDDNCKRNYELFVLDKINWKNLTVKNQGYTPDGKPYRCLFITDKSSEIGEDKTKATIANHIPATVIGKSPDIYILTPFSSTYLLLGHFKPRIEKLKNDGNDSETRLLSYTDLIDSVCDSNDFISKLITEYNFDFKQPLSNICETSSLPSLDSDDDSVDEYFKLSFNKISKLVSQKLHSLEKYLERKDTVKSLKSRMKKMYPEGIPGSIQQLLWRKQAIALLSIYIDSFYINECISDNPEYNFEVLNVYLSKLKQEQAKKELVDDSIQQLHDGTAAAQKKQNKKVKSTATVKQSKQTRVAVGKGALDMFFKKKD